MSQADELLDSLTEPEVATYSVNPDMEPHIVINEDRTIAVPDELKHIAVQGEHNIETVTFDCPRYWDGHDLSQMSVRINFQRPDGHREPYIAENLRVDDTDTSLIHFDWTISGNVTAVKGNISFMVCAKIADAEGVTEREWHSRLNQDLVIDEGLDCSGDEIVEQNPDILESILARLDTLESTGGVSEEQIANAVEAYMAEHPSNPGDNLNLTVETITVGEDSGGEDTNEPVAVTGLSLDLTSYSATVGGGFYINPVVLPTNATNRSVSWESNNTAVATVNDMGYVECIAEGDAVITCTTEDGGYTATCAVSVAAAESGGSDSGDNTGGETTGQKIQLSTLERTEGGIKADGTAHTLSNTYHAVIPYTEGMYIRTIWKNVWVAATYPPILVVAGDTYSIPDYAYMVDENGEFKTAGLTTATTGNIAEATLSGYATDSNVIINMLLLDSATDEELDNTDSLYYIPGGER